MALIYQCCFFRGGMSAVAGIGFLITNTLHSLPLLPQSCLTRSFVIGAKWGSMRNPRSTLPPVNFSLRSGRGRRSPRRRWSASFEGDSTTTLRQCPAGGACFKLFFFRIFLDPLTPPSLGLIKMSLCSRVGWL